MFDKQKWLDIAEIVDAFRVIPRVMIGLFVWLCVDAYLWMKGLDLTPGEKQMIFTTVMGAATVWLSFYLNSGRKWSDK